MPRLQSIDGLESTAATLMSTSARTDCAAIRQKRPRFRQHFLKAPPGIAGARIVPAQFLQQFLVSVDEAMAPLDPSFAREPAAALAHDLKSSLDPRACYFA